MSLDPVVVWIARGLVRTSKRIARWRNGIRKWVPSGDAFSRTPLNRSKMTATLSHGPRFGERTSAMSAGHVVQRRLRESERADADHRGAVQSSGRHVDTSAMVSAIGLCARRQSSAGGWIDSRGVRRLPTSRASGSVNHAPAHRHQTSRTVPQSVQRRRSNRRKTIESTRADLPRACDGLSGVGSVLHGRSRCSWRRQAKVGFIDFNPFALSDSSTLSTHAARPSVSTGLGFGELGRPRT